MHTFLLESGLAERLGIVRYREMPRYRYWTLKQKGKSDRTFEYTTEKSLGYDGKEPEKYWAIERRWVKTKGGRTGKVVRTVGFKLRRKAKDKAYEWYTKALAG